MSNIDNRVLREAAERATESDWIVDAHEGWHAVIPVADAVNGNYIIAEFQGPESKRNRDFVAAANPATVLALLDELEAKDKRNAELEDLLEAEIKSWMQRYDSANNRREAAERRIAEQKEIMRQAASDISYAIFNLTGSDLSRLNPGVVETTDPTDTALIAERSLRAAAAAKGEAS